MKHLDRRLFIGTALGLAALSLLPGRASADWVTFNVLRKKGTDFPYKLTDQQWRQKLGPDAYSVLRDGENERAGTSPLLRERRKGVYACGGCGVALFSSAAKAMANDYPRFRAPLAAKALGLSTDFGIILPRTEVHCKNCGSHLGYKFMVDGHGADIWRYEVNGAALVFQPA